MTFSGKTGYPIFGVRDVVLEVPFRPASPPFRKQGWIMTDLLLSRVSDAQAGWQDTSRSTPFTPHMDAPFPSQQV